MTSWLCLTATLIFGGTFICVLSDWIEAIKQRRREAIRGFEVKLNTGDEPVIEKERENDHG